MISLTENNQMLGYEQLCSYPGISHFVTTRQGGCSKGAYSSFNCSPYSGDELQQVLANQYKLCAWLAILPTQLLIPFQTHGSEVRVVDSTFLGLDTIQQKNLLTGIDALVTRERGICICVSTADCVPMLLYDPENKVIAAVHAGWRGTVARIVDKTLHVMQQTYGTDIQKVIACIGPSISLASFEVGEEVCHAFQESGFDLSKIVRWKGCGEKPHIDLWEANQSLLVEAGVPKDNIELSGICTYLRQELFFSARRLGIKSGRILSGIMLKPY